ncbi:hypothetical protein E2562_030354 [Oryza meyeriana var. granulata]|uniref:WIYLD domain-containing protein n=1 Tax=Oryza meyeriana var. granulata TaxID=110450 RepID=A0A6G1DPK3_9ORYZ|nr:hypothetical protein E2562_030354 [Oryza meyeriana var. granulata]
MPRRRGHRRIDAAIDHFTPMGYATADSRTVVKQLLKVYGNNGWPFLEEGAYRVVQEALFEKQEQEEQLQLEQEEDEAPQQLEEAMDEAPLENSMPIVEVHNEVPAKAEPDSMLVDLSAVEAILPLPESTLTSGTRRPCYGWLIEYESESDNEEWPSSQQHQMHVPSQQSCDMKPLNW